MPYFLYVMLAHWISDFVFQTRWQAVNKSKNWKALFHHVATYTISMTMLVGLIGSVYALHQTGHWVEPTPHGNQLLTMFLLITFVTHFATDAVTSRITSRLYAKGDFHNFFVIIGLDQMIHYATLYGTLVFLGVM